MQTAIFFFDIFLYIKKVIIEINIRKTCVGNELKFLKY